MDCVASWILRVAEAVRAAGCTGLLDAVIGKLADNVPCAAEVAVRLMKVDPVPATVVTGPRPSGDPVPLYPNVTETPPIFWPFSVTVTIGAGFRA